MTKGVFSHLGSCFQGCASILWIVSKGLLMCCSQCGDILDAIYKWLWKIDYVNGAGGFSDLNANHQDTPSTSQNQL